LVIVESPAKARTIGRFLSDGFRVEASIGHIRDLPRNAAEIPASYKKHKWSRLGVNVEKGFRPLYVVPADKKAHVKMLKQALKECETLYLATDEDREGESISWHLVEVLKPKVPIRRLVFHEITESAIRHALENPREVNLNLVRAQEARRIVDRLYGYEVSPLLWRKIRPRLSAGRVQSVAVRLIVERERERLAFVPTTWWDLHVDLHSEKGDVRTRLVSWQDKRLAMGKDFDDRGQLKPGRENLQILDEAAARQIAETLAEGTATVTDLEERNYRDRPSAPFTTSTLQQECNRRLRWTARRTMRVAQRLYENGWITYMRTDSTSLSNQAIGAARALITERFGAEYLPGKPRLYTKKSKGAQEAHEAIRPAGAEFRSPDQAKVEIGGDEARLYDLIWRRAIASQMEDARGKTVNIRFRAGDARLQVGGRTLTFLGHRRAYGGTGSNSPILPTLAKGEQLTVTGVDPKGHVTQPPARLTEASLVKELETRGIGRPSTYAAIIDTVQQRGYAFRRGTALIPTYTAFAVTMLLEQHLTWLVDYDFTAQMENQLDEIALGEGETKQYLQRFYLGDEGLQHRLSEAAESIDPRRVCSIPLGETEDGETVEIRVGRYGPFLSQGDVRADIPAELAPDEMSLPRAIELLEERRRGPRQIGVDPTSGKTLFMMKGRFGPYVQLGTIEEAGDDKPPRASLIGEMKPDDVDLPLALQLLSLPRTLGAFPDTGEPVLACAGRYGPFVQSGKTSRTLPEPMSVLTIELAAALELLKQPAVRRSSRSLIREVGVDPSTERTVKLMNGRWGPYVTDGETNASLRRQHNPDTLELEEAIELIRVRAATPKRPRRKTTKARSKTTKARTTKAKAKTTRAKTTAKAKTTTKAKTTAKVPKTPEFCSCGERDPVGVSGPDAQ